MTANYPSIVLLSKLTNRLRVKLNKPLKNEEEIINALTEHEGIIDCRYNSVIQSLLINFNENIEVEEVLIRLTILYSKENGFMPIRIISSLPKREIPILAYYSLGIIAVAGVSRLFIQNISVTNLLNWLAAGTTILSIVEHIKDDIDNKGTVDPEAISVLYLLNAIRNGNFVEASAVTWLTNYGRHFFNLNFEGITLKVNKVTNTCTNEIFYNVSSIGEESPKNKNMDFIKVLLTKYIERQSPTTRNNVMFTNSNLNLVQDKLFPGFNNECEKIVFSNKGYNGNLCSI
ncbi:hypothetical protein [Clostridium cellulovorans]|uniref:Uncharacterized protein n=1 Tax=Clostridium cellulovorans (strain ATCC 35296 / DSM 3052 / OCM 3 / 743B) TaxID=573061 RepID=D9SL23_CLOC7|nr:hypothetical protein [Clostridium cellulovorans]ADL53595.1 hypothetical protein Clocel_3929 [Clostridium cellulovorans 743B]